ncbi:MAG: trans-aconitate 2-methyltransferase [bacterium]
MEQDLQRFQAAAGEYDSFLEMIPKYDRIVELMVEVFDQWHREKSPDRVAEIGIGTAQLTKVVVDRYEPVQFYGIDGTASMIDQAKSNLGSVGDDSIQLEQVMFEDWSPPRDVDWVYSNLSIHHLVDLEKRDLYERIFGALNRGGKFLLSDLVRIPDEQFDLYKNLYWDRLTALGFSENDIQDRWEQHRTHDDPADLRATFRWLREIGFTGVECVWKDFNRAIIVASKYTRS